MFSVAVALIYVPVRLVINFAIWTEAEGLLLDLFLLFSREEKALVGLESDGMNHANSVVDVATV